MLTVKELYKGKWLLSERKKSHFLVIKHFSLELHVIWDESLTSVRVTSVHSATDVWPCSLWRALVRVSLRGRPACAGSSLPTARRFLAPLLVTCTDRVASLFSLAFLPPRT